jgi:hypothetical protein
VDQEVADPQIDPRRFRRLFPEKFRQILAFDGVYLVRIEPGSVKGKIFGDVSKVFRASDFGETGVGNRLAAGGFGLEERPDFPFQRPEVQSGLGSYLCGIEESQSVISTEDLLGSWLFVFQKLAEAIGGRFVLAEIREDLFFGVIVAWIINWAFDGPMHRQFISGLAPRGSGS